MPKESIVAKWTSTKLYLGSRYNIETKVKDKTRSKLSIFEESRRSWRSRNSMRSGKVEWSEGTVD